MEKNIKASIIITTYNRPTYLARAIQSCINQKTQFSYEIIVVDDNGKDSPQQKETEEVISQFKDIIYSPLEKNSGACTARNQGVSLAQGKYVFFLDDDDEFSDTKLQNQIEYLTNHPNLDGCLAAFKRIDAVSKNEIISDTNFPVIGYFVHFTIHGNFFTPMLCMKKSSLEKIGGFDTIPRFQDRYLMLKALENNMQFDCLNDQLHTMYEHNGLRITNKNIEKSITSLDSIKSKILVHKQEFSRTEWNVFLIKDIRMRGTIHYVATNYYDRVKGSHFFFKSFCKSLTFNDLLMMFKCFLKIR
jgi:glycosyltransferase involved in cell wall biosynthesis